MSRLAAKPELQERALSAIDSLGRTGKTARAKLGLAGLCKLVVVAMQKFPDRQQLQTQAADAMYALKNEGNLLALRSAGAVQRWKWRFRGSRAGIRSRMRCIGLGATSMRTERQAS
jgi:hypothetical protein